MSGTTALRPKATGPRRASSAHAEPLHFLHTSGLPCPLKPLSDNRIRLKSLVPLCAVSLTPLHVLVEVGHLGAALGLNLGPPLVLPEVIPLAPAVSARTPPIALTGVLTGLALRDVLAIPGNVLGGQASWE